MYCEFCGTGPTCGVCGRDDVEQLRRETEYNADDFARDYPNGEPVIVAVPFGWDHV